VPDEKIVPPRAASRDVLASRAVRRLEKLRAAALALEARHESLISATDPALRRSACNLVHYLAVRSYDVRGLQSDLAQMGLSSLGRMEAHALASLDILIEILHMMRGRPLPTRQADIAAVSMVGGKALLERHTSAILGPSPAGHKTRIMVTMPSEAAHDSELIGDLLQRGMQIMRINCAHDDCEAWSRMLFHLRRAERRLGLRCKVSFDLAGPKLRTGSIEPGVGVVKWKPQRDTLGRVVMPAVVQLTLANTEPAAGQCSIPGAAALIAKARVGDLIELDDARGKPRQLEIVDVSSQACTCHTQQTGYLQNGSELRLRRGKRTIAKMVIAELPPRPQRILVRPGDYLELTSADAPGRPARFNLAGELIEPGVISCTLPEVFSRVSPGERIFFDDGRIGGIIRKVGPGRMRVEIISAVGGAAKLASEKGINLPDTDLLLPALTGKDKQDLDFVVRHADMVALSFVQRPSDVADLIAELARHDARHIGIVLKIETRRGFEHLPSLLLSAMRHPLVAVMVARGDLGVEVGFERLSEVQEEILWLCEAAHVPAIWATQVLESLAQSGMSSRAEVTDAAMAGRAECVMLNKGPYVRQALSFLADVLHRMQSHQRKKTSTLRRLHISHLEW
jgi:pyruvate kinase